MFEENPNPSPQLRVRALCAILIGLSAFVVGCYVPLGRVVGQFLPSFAKIGFQRLRIVVSLGMAGGVYAFWALTQSAGGLAVFLANLSTWRTTGVLAGVGHLTFPISTVLPACALLLVLRHLPKYPFKMTWYTLFAFLVYGASLFPVLLLGFRIGFLTAILQLIAVWHYRRRRLRIKTVFVLCTVVLVLLSVYSSLRRTVTGDTPYDNPLLQAVVFRVPGLDTVERVVWRLDQGEPHRGFSRVFAESATIIGPRVLWPGKPQPASLDFADIFFYDFFLGRGDRIDDIRSGVSPTIIGELLWIGGLGSVVAGSLLLGSATVALNAWREKAPRAILHVWVPALSVAPFAIFVEAPQNTLNGFVLLGIFAVGTCAMLTICLHRLRDSA